MFKRFFAASMPGQAGVVSWNSSIGTPVRRWRWAAGRAAPAQAELVRGPDGPQVFAVFWCWWTSRMDDMG